ncbi:hypothetical protein B0T26DRAFT_218475 [Lasiosphaeria miniovina]|uniref:Uncharacterized protein n=1 Tax=Lasiosphaeria miniovina TaxID=1954250 RepID=A0AA40E0F5_9PEZI|nr:uncharacterized protein B0T26DRAFT_218475 [Lasiosphaeria miniovina]KAK0722420.1 hypothetical protein B0T26DRAFT_218475 [Lasiosphaeria miniovina]
MFKTLISSGALPIWALLLSCWYNGYNFKACSKVLQHSNARHGSPYARQWYKRSVFCFLSLSRVTTLPSTYLVSLDEIARDVILMRGASPIDRIHRVSASRLRRPVDGWIRSAEKEKPLPRRAVLSSLSAGWITSELGQGGRKTSVFWRILSGQLKVAGKDRVRLRSPEHPASIRHSGSLTWI